MIKNLFEVGDIVTLCWADGAVSHGNEITNTPQGAGDSWQMLDKDGVLTLVNIYASTFEAMVLEKKKGENER
jgi:hypothetical protein